MSNIWFVVSFITLLIIAMGFVFYPLRKKKLTAVALSPFVMVTAAFAYWHWGAWFDWQEYQLKELKHQQVQAILKSVNGPQDLINKLKARLAATPESARGWYLLGRLYAGQSDWQKARDAFAKAYQLQADDEQIAINYGQSLWQENHQQFDETNRELFKKILQKNRNQPDALAMLAMDAYLSHDYKQSIDYWQRLLKLAPPESEDAKAMRKAIAKAQSMMGINRVPALDPLGG